MDTTTKTLNAANRRGAAKKAVFPGVRDVRFDARSRRVVLSLGSGLDLVFPPSAVPSLENAGASDFRGYEISPSGFGIHMGKMGGSKTSAAKSHAAKANGRLGGRPRKSV
jgi:hypothetical protein